MAAGNRGGRRRTLEQIDKDAKALVLHCQGKSNQEIADELGWSGRSGAFNAVKRALADRQQSKFSMNEHFDAAVARYMGLMQRCQEIIDTPHYAVTNAGKLVTTFNPDTGVEEPVLDDGPKQRAITEQRHLGEALDILLDIKPPSKRVVEVVTQSVVDKQIEAELKALRELADGGGAPDPSVLREP